MPKTLRQHGGPIFPVWKSNSDQPPPSKKVGHLSPHDTASHQQEWRPHGSPWWLLKDCWMPSANPGLLSTYCTSFRCL